MKLSYGNFFAKEGWQTEARFGSYMVSEISIVWIQPTEPKMLYYFRGRHLAFPVIWVPVAMAMHVPL